MTSTGSSTKWTMCHQWWSAENIAVVTDANRGIEFETTHQLATHGITVILTSRDVVVSEESAKVLHGGLNVVFHHLYIVEDESIKSFYEWVKEKQINNAGGAKQYSVTELVFAAKWISTLALSLHEEQQFLKVIWNASRLRHPNIITLHGYCVEQGQHMLVYEYVRNLSLDHVLHSEAYTPLSWSICLRISIEIA
ncbi:protein STRUBBELIG-receptor family 2 [Tanacetum coccineum]|uniref:Protein STRUBBELIG-receptor family 2 n=1 Tax=Tanacetum coccineum TaxID=301880 RepID=A0ABQ5FXS3_9ASTR